MDVDKIVKSAIKNFFVITTVGALINSTDALSAQKMEKCYGIVKAGMNDCPTSKGSCAGSANRDNMPDAFIFLPPGSCKKIVGGSLVPNDSKKK